MFLMLASLVTSGVTYNQNRHLGMDLDIDVRVFAVGVVLGDQNSRRVELLCGERAAWHVCGREINGLAISERIYVND